MGATENSGHSPKRRRGRLVEWSARVHRLDIVAAAERVARDVARRIVVELSGHWADRDARKSDVGATREALKRVIRQFVRVTVDVGHKRVLPLDGPEPEVRARFLNDGLREEREMD